MLARHDGIAGQVSGVALTTLLPCRWHPDRATCAVCWMHVLQLWTYWSRTPQSTGMSVPRVRSAMYKGKLEHSVACRLGCNMRLLSA